MSDALSFAELDGQQVELLPARAVLSMFTRGTDSGDSGDARSFLTTLLGLGTGYNGPSGNTDGSTSNGNS